MAGEGEASPPAPRQKKGITLGDPLPASTKFSASAPGPSLPPTSFLGASAKFPAASAFRVSSAASVGYPKITGEDSTQTQTDKGDQTQGQEEEEEEEDPYQTEDLLQAGPSRASKGKEPMRRPRTRRFTIEPGEFEEEFVLTEPEDQEGLFEKVQTVTSFIDSVTNHPEEWCNAIRTMATSIAAYQGQVAELTRNVHTAKQQSASLTQQLMEADNQEEIQRLRHLRQKYKDQAANKTEEVERLKAENVKLKEQIRTHAQAESRIPPEDEYLDSDDDNFIRTRQGNSNRRRNPSVPTNPGTALLGGSRQPTPATNTTRTNATKSDNKYKDVSEFKGTEGSRFYDSWRTHLYAKFRRSWELFEDEQSKIDYIRDHCKEVAYDVIKERSIDPTNEDRYTTADEMVFDLDQMFAEFDRESKAEAELLNPKFAMGASDPKETFPAFYARFVGLIAPLGLTDSQKRSHLKRTVSWRLRNRIMDGTVSANFPAMVARLRQLDTELRINDDNAPKKGSNDNKSGQGRTNSSNGSSGTRGGSATGSRKPFSGYRLPEHQAAQLKKQGRCFKCLEFGHRHFDANAPDACKTAKWPTKDQIALKLAAAGIELPELDNTSTAQPSNPELPGN